MTLAQLPPAYIQNPHNGSIQVAAGARIVGVTNTDDIEVQVFTTREGSTLVTYPVIADSEGEFAAWVASQTVQIEYHPDDDVLNNPAIREVYSGDDIDDMLTIGDVAGFPDYVFSPLTFGGDPTGGTDSTAAIQAALDAAQAVEGTVHFGNGDAVWKYSSTLEGYNNIRLTGASGGMGGNDRGPTLSYWGTGTAAAIGFGDNSRFEIDHLTLVYRGDTGFTGPLLNLSGPTSDVSSWHIHHCEFDRRGVATDSARAFIRLHKAITGQISECHFDAAQTHIMMGDPDVGSSWVNGVHVRNCNFNDCLPDPANGQILIGARSMQACTITDSTFSGGSASAYVPIRGTNSGALDVDGNYGGDASANVVYTLTISGNYFGDGSGGTQSAMIGGLNTQTDGPILILNNWFANNYRRCFQAGGNGAGVVMIGNKAVNAPLYGTWDGTPGGRLTAIGNETGTEGIVRAGEEPSGGMTQFARNWNVVEGYFAVSDNDTFNDVVATDRDDDAAIIMGGPIPQADPYPDMSHSSAIYNKVTGAGGFLALQAGTGDVDNGVQLVAGLGTPTVKVYANGHGVAVNGKTPPTTVPTAPATAGTASYSAGTPVTDGDFNPMIDVLNAHAAIINDLRAKLVAFGIYA